MSEGWRTAWITGASSGIGRAVALLLAGRGVKVAASARSSGALQSLAVDHPNVHPFPLDVTDPAAMREAAAAIEAHLGPIDLAVFSAGVWRPMSVTSFDGANASEAISVNYLGTVYGIEAALPGMLARRAGHLALISSVAGYRGLPSAAAYGPSKAALISLAESLKPGLDTKGIAISVINPGYVETPMTEGSKAPLPYIISAEDAARRIVTGLERRKFEIAFPWQMVVRLKLVRLLPYPLFFWLVRNFSSGSGKD